MSHYPRGRDPHNVVHYVHESQGIHRTRDPWCRRMLGTPSYGQHRDVDRVPPYTPVTCIECVALRARR